MLRSNVPEGQLSYGFKKRPIDQPTIKIIPNIPEEKLYDVRSKVIEFKKPKCSEESEFENSDEDEEEEPCNRKRYNLKRVHGFSYSDLGYHESNAQDVQFVDVPISTTARPEVPRDESHYGAVVDVVEDAGCLPPEYCSYTHCAQHELLTR